MREEYQMACPDGRFMLSLGVNTRNQIERAVVSRLAKLPTDLQLRLVPPGENRRHGIAKPSNEKRGRVVAGYDQLSTHLLGIMWDASLLDLQAATAPFAQ